MLPAVSREKPLSLQGGCADTRAKPCACREVNPKRAAELLRAML
jgi:hypothetical protein